MTRPHDPSFMDKYTLEPDEANDIDVKDWLAMLDVDQVSATRCDWHTSKTFDIFLSALDVHNPGKKQRQAVDKTTKKITRDLNRIKLDAEQDTKAHCSDNSRKEAHRAGENKAKGRDNGSAGVMETILSAEALKILSELPDLSHMSTTRSFIFPKADKAHK